MKKLKLNLEDLKVDSFETMTQEKAKGTVNGFITGTHPECPDTINDPTCINPSEIYTCLKVDCWATGDVMTCERLCDTVYDPSCIGPSCPINAC